ncbi:hypothetical protein J8F10_37470 [Gemmata sp. G18]|uniref:Uncharacterized protein n=1 Tax=Gemmata palustris TaxID=2822762 RepID=A0ABS5C4M5_9BACT|nr:hypothetical protein [Gemmata palustris]MBP3960946.1 hypothetical protein [Gemmata palustris]
MTRSELDREFLGSEWEIGHSYGSEGPGWVAAVTLIRLNLGRDLTARERVLFADGWRAGCRDRAAWKEDMRVRADELALADIPF